MLHLSSVSESPPDTADTTFARLPIQEGCRDKTIRISMRISATLKYSVVRTCDRETFTFHHRGTLAGLRSPSDGIGRREATRNKHSLRNLGK